MPMCSRGSCRPRTLCAGRPVACGPVNPGRATESRGQPETLLFALAFAANGERERAAHLLEWTAGHRTKLGAIPEKVCFDGRPAHVAPLAWSAALVVLTLDKLRA